MKLMNIEAQGGAIGQRAADALRDRIVRRAKLPADVTIKAVNGGIEITGKRLRRRMMDDAQLRNFAHD